MKNLVQEEVDRRLRKQCENCKYNIDCDKNIKHLCPNAYKQLSSDLILGADLYKKQYGWHDLQKDPEDMPEKYIKEIDYTKMYDLKCLVMRGNGDIVKTSRNHLPRDHYFFWHCLESFDKRNPNRIIKWMFLEY